MYKVSRLSNVFSNSVIFEAMYIRVELVWRCQPRALSAISSYASRLAPPDDFRAVDDLAITSEPLSEERRSTN